LLLRDVLELRRAEGSETMLVGARVDLPGVAFAWGRVILAWLGDSRLRCWGLSDERTWELGETFRTDQRWSSRRGPVGGEPHLALFPLTNGQSFLMSRLAAYSDGLATLDRLAILPSSSSLQGIVDETAVSPTSDDVSVVEVWFDKGSPREGD
jgi:hypothetical protein